VEKDSSIRIWGLDGRECAPSAISASQLVAAFLCRFV
jgi:hypothetical protein